MLQKRFSDNDGRLYFFDRRRPQDGVRRTTSGNLFCEGHLYSEIAEDGTKNPALEDYFSAVEGQVEAIIEKAVLAARQDGPPNFTQTERTLWDHFFVLQFKRVPDVHKL